MGVIVIPGVIPEAAIRPRGQGLFRCEGAESSMDSDVYTTIRRVY